MGFNSAKVTVICDRCGREHQDVDLTAMGGNGWDARNLEADLEAGGWRQDGEDWIGPNCVEAEVEAAT